MPLEHPIGRLVLEGDQRPVTDRGPDLLARRTLSDRHGLRTLLGNRFPWSVSQRHQGLIDLPDQRTDFLREDQVVGQVRWAMRTVTATIERSCASAWVCCGHCN
ncbi:hypothetical protein F8B43_3395 [Methylorubrum populi]|uniref:Uncharacterized protein n=1 Tax=Methylorubrum populi TaxID=223967 RepID=A0A833N194_9HYPH|nr:hypothetical protein F8B43_3395 [Methylorubrum populi]